jgi:hypothetical protein
MQVRARFWVETVLAALAAGLFVLTLVSHDWIERIFGVEPDEGNGSLEWLITGGLIEFAVVLGAAALAEWQYAQTRA